MFWGFVFADFNPGIDGSGFRDTFGFRAKVLWITSRVLAAFRGLKALWAFRAFFKVQRKHNRHAQRLQYPLIKEYSLHRNQDAYVIYDLRNILQL